MNPESRRRQRVIRSATFLLALVLIGVILWIDIATGLWQQFVIVAGLAAGCVTFLLTVLVLDRILARAAERRWAPVIRLALSEFLHDMADEEQSEISRAWIVPRLIPQLPEPLVPDALHDQLAVIRHQVVEERSRLAATLATWAEILSSAASNEQVLLHVAEIAMQLDRVRDGTLDVEADPSLEQQASLRLQIEQCNTAFAAIVAEIEQQLTRIRGVEKTPQVAR